MKRLAQLGSLTICSMGAGAQWWAPVGNGFPEPGNPRCAYADVSSNHLLVGGSFPYAQNGLDSVTVVGIAAWDGTEWDSLAMRVYPWDGPPSNICSPTFSFQRIDGELYANGAWIFPDTAGTLNQTIAIFKEDSLRWEALECSNPPIGGMQHLLHVAGDTSFITGYPGSMCGEAPTCAFSYYNGTIERWSPFDVWPEHSSNYVGYVFPFQGQYYMTGLLNDTANSAFYGFLRYTGTEWEPVPGFETYGPIKKVLIHDDKLYVCGYFFEANGQPGNLVASYDGSQWDNLGGGLLYSLTAPTSGNPTAVDMFFDGDTLYVAGQFKYAGGIAAQNIAKWNGAQWCGFPGVFDTYGTLHAAMWNNELYVVGGFMSIDGVTMNQVARYTGGYYVENCSAPIGIPEAQVPDAPDVSAEDPGRSWWLTFETQHERSFNVHGPDGRSVMFMASTSSRVLLDLSEFTSGVYAVHVIDDNNATMCVRLVHH